MDTTMGRRSLLRAGAVLAGSGDPAHVHHVGALGHDLVHAGEGGVQRVGRAAVVEGVGRPVDDGHHDQPPVGHVEGTQAQHRYSQADGMLRA